MPGGGCPPEPCSGSANQDPYEQSIGNGAMAPAPAQQTPYEVEPQYPTAPAVSSPAPLPILPAPYPAPQSYPGPQVGTGSVVGNTQNGNSGGSSPGSTIGITGPTVGINGPTVGIPGPEIGIVGPTIGSVGSSTPCNGQSPCPQKNGQAGWGSPGPRRAGTNKTRVGTQRKSGIGSIAGKLFGITNDTLMTTQTAQALDIMNNEREIQEKLFEMTRKYIEESTLKTKFESNYGVTPIASSTLFSLLHYIESGCTDVDKNDALQLLNPQTYALQGSVPYTEFVEINVENETYYKCNFADFAQHSILNVKHDRPPGQIEMKYIFKLFTKWSRFGMECLNAQDTFHSDNGYNVVTNFITMYGNFQSGEIRKSSARFVTIPFPNSVTGEMKLVFILPTINITISKFVRKFFANMAWDDFTTAIQAKVNAVSIPSVIVNYGFSDRMESAAQSISQKVETLIHISGKYQDNASCNSPNHINYSDVTRINRPFIVLIMRNNHIMSCGIVKTMKVQ